MNPYQGKVTDILANAEKYHRDYYQANTFRGPSLYFHQRALQTRQSPNILTHIEYVYATLAAWGMHRMGKRGSKMQDFHTFCRSLEPLKERIAEAQHFTPQSMGPGQWAILNEIFVGIKLMASGTSLVGNSKVMHHMMPNIVPPIDREYTLRFLRGNTNISNNIDREWQTMKGIISEFFIPIACDIEFNVRAGKWMASQDEYPWDTSVLKVVDNLLIGSRKGSNDLMA